MYCKICSIPLGREDSEESTQCDGCGKWVCYRCETLLSDALTEIGTQFFCAECLDKPAITDLRPYLRTGEHKAVSRDGKTARWFGVRRLTLDDGAIVGWYIAHDNKVWACRDPLEVEAAIREMF